MARFETLQDWLNWQESLYPRVIDLGLDRAASAFKRLNPDNRKPTTITVAGTNGKGSCVAYLEAIYRAQGYRVGAYTSPHILHYNERIKVDGMPVADDLICEAFARIDRARGDNTLSYFEFGTLAALDIFQRAGVDIQLLEVGLGGRLDAVNIVDADLAIVTSIGIDHVDWLGATRELIAREKAGIFRSHVTAVVGDVDPPDSLFLVAAEKGTPLLLINRDFHYQNNQQDWDWYFADTGISHLPLPGLKGEHQFTNAATVLTAVAAMQQLLPVSEASIREGLEKVTLTGRFQLVQGDIPVLLDVCHNPHAAKSLYAYLQQNFADYQIHAVFAMMRDKDISEVIRILSPRVHSWFLAPIQNRRSASEDMLRQAFEANGLSQQVVAGFSDFECAFSAARKNACQGGLILVFGSFFLVSEYLKLHSIKR